MNRRDFIKQTVVTAIGLYLPIQLSASLTIVEVKILNSFMSAVEFGGFRVENGKSFIDGTIDIGALWRHVRLIDSEGREWQTVDSGQTWRHGLMEFSLDVEEIDE